MKHIKLLFSISIALIIAANLNAQTSYLDSSTYYTFCNAPSISQGLSFETYSKEIVFLDSSGNDGKYYSVYYNSKDFKQYQTEYFLHLKNDSVFFSGKLQNESGDSFLVKDLLIYDFTLNVGDTMRIYHLASGLNIELLIDSIKDVKYLDNQLRRTQYFTILTGVPSEFYRINSPFFASQGLGSNFGLLPFKLIRRNSPYWQELISVCSKEKDAVYSANGTFNLWNIEDYCDENEIIDLIDTMKSVSIDKINIQKMIVFPNPANNILQIQGSFSGNIFIYNPHGQLVLDSPFENQINVSSLPNGMYHFFIYEQNRLFRGNFIKHE